MSAIHELRQTIARLRAPGGCPWDREQTHASLTRCLIDECSELLETIDALDMPHMREELGDVLIQVVFHAQLAEEAGHFDLDDVAREVNEKLIRRHPHVFGGSRLATSEQVLVKWEQIKAQEKAAKAAAAAKAANATAATANATAAADTVASATAANAANTTANADADTQPARENVFKDLPPRLPALMFAEAVWKQIQKKNLPHDSAVDAARVAGLAATLDDETLGRALFELAAAARVKKLDPEGALRRHATQVMSNVEKHIQQQGA
ncbi:MAG: MazG family protein [Opitutaceae bacterium]|jgi:XTP/dITP diphosphohydrolase/tetrapyrrole methylase family protein/MazG family protein|nr:MazG family protein [Opitutaceae bacterium]